MRERERDWKGQEVTEMRKARGVKMGSVSVFRYLIVTPTVRLRDGCEGLAGAFAVLLGLDDVLAWRGCAG